MIGSKQNRITNMKSLITSSLVGIFAIASSFAAEVGKQAPAFTANNTNGQKVSLSDYKDKIVVLEWTNFDCPFVKKHYSSKNMQKLQTEYTEKGIVWMTVNSSAEGKQGQLEPSKLAEKVAEQGGKPSEILVDTDGAVGKAYDAKVTPHMMIISKDGSLVYSGAIDSTPSTDAADIESAKPLFADALNAVIAGKKVTNSKNKPYGCGVKY